MGLRLYFEIAAPDNIWEQGIILATPPGNKCHVEVETRKGFWSSREPIGVGFIPSLATTRQWKVLETPWEITDQAMALAESMVGWRYDYLGAFLSALGRSRSRSGYAFCSGAVSQFAQMCGEPALAMLPNPNQYEQLVSAAIGRPMTIVMEQPSDKALDDLYKLAVTRHNDQCRRRRSNPNR